MEWERSLKAIVDYPQPDPWHIRYVRGERFKLYGDGRFYDLQADMDETKPLRPAIGTPEAETARRELRAVLDRYAKIEGLKAEPQYTYPK